MPLFSVGHSVQPIEKLLDLLQTHRIDVVVDVRSAPYSRWQPQFNADPLGRALEHAGVRYVPMGAQLGGRPEDPVLYDPDGKVSYARLSETAPFRAGVARLLDGAERYRISLLCTEAAPADCHRHHLISRVLWEEHGLEVQHILTDGRLAPYTHIPAGDRRSPGRWQLPLFE